MSNLRFLYFDILAEAVSELSNSKDHPEITISIVEGQIAMQEVTRKNSFER